MHPFSVPPHSLPFPLTSLAPHIFCPPLIAFPSFCASPPDFYSPSLIPFSSRVWHVTWKRCLVQRSVGREEWLWVMTPDTTASGTACPHAQEGRAPHTLLSSPSLVHWTLDISSHHSVGYLSLPSITICTSRLFSSSRCTACFIYMYMLIYFLLSLSLFSADLLN